MTTERQAGLEQTNLKQTLNKKIPFTDFGRTTRYHLKYTSLLAGVPLACGALLVLLLSVFAKLNLYFLEANGMILDEQLRDAYFRQVEMEMFSVVGYLFLQVVITAVASFMVMRWATAPFAGAQKMVLTAIENPDKLKPNSRWLSESPIFDRLVWLFCLRVKSGGENQIKQTVPSYGTNIPFLAKFLVTFTILSFSTGYVLSIIMDSVYRRIVEMALQLTKSTGVTGHYFLAQQDMLQEATTFATGFAMVCYFILGLNISRYMATMMQVFSRAMHEDKFPLVLRNTDLFDSLAVAMNRAQEKLKFRA